MTSCLLSCQLSPFQKGVYSKRKELLIQGSKLFPFTVPSLLLRKEIRPKKKVVDSQTPPQLSKRSRMYDFFQW